MIRIIEEGKKQLDWFRGACTICKCVFCATEDEVKNRVHEPFNDRDAAYMKCPNKGCREKMVVMYQCDPPEE